MSEENVERRRFVRLPVSLMISLKSEEEAEDFVTNYTFDLSLGGMFLKTGAPKSIGTTVCLQVHTPPPTGLIEIMGKVVYHNAQTKEGIISGMGIEFTKMNGNAREILQKFIRGARSDVFSRGPQTENWAIVNAIGNIMEILGLSLNLIARPY